MIPVSRLVIVRGNAGALRAATSTPAPRWSVGAGALFLATLLALVIGALAGAGLRAHDQPTGVPDRAGDPRTSPADNRPKKRGPGDGPPAGAANPPAGGQGGARS